ncbi:hypothetical protein [uncultured Methanoregula sp.]|uniref:hypothetical protein n=1 Tax=uncultured Methanoregula sp. TaxID=1005933 RepID=UPI002AAB72E7|nr:hypothetical protein [uncultured Methanoregula sp.]
MVGFEIFLTTFFNEPSNIIAFCAVIISIISIALTIISLWIQRKHDRISVKPIAHIHVNNLLGEISLSVKNDGLGPMIIKSIETFRTNDKNKLNLGWPPISIIKTDYKIPKSTPQMTIDLESCPIYNGNSLSFFKQVFDPAISEEFADAKKTSMALANLTLRIKYTSVYEEEQYETSYALAILNVIASNQI